MLFYRSWVSRGSLLIKAVKMWRLFSMVWSLIRIAPSTVPKVMMTEWGRLGLWVGNVVGKDM
jgi:hypothetical protein